jgi:hypothetical protein
MWGSALCKHGRRRDRCKECGNPLICPGDGKNACPYQTMIDKHNNRYDLHCPRCFVSKHANATDPTLRERVAATKSCIHARELTVREFLEVAFPDHKWTFDRRLVGSLKRPDARTAVADRVIIVEIDEDSHRSYTCSTEREREAAFYNHFKPRTVILIRFNPDQYTRDDGTKVPSCFQWSPTRVSTIVAPKQQAQWDARLAYLKRCIDDWVDPESTVPPPQEGRLVFTQELYYDNILDTVTDADREAIIGRFKRAARKRKAGF